MYSQDGNQEEANDPDLVEISKSRVSAYVTHSSKRETSE